MEGCRLGGMEIWEWRGEGGVVESAMMLDCPLSRLDTPDGVCEFGERWIRILFLCGGHVSRCCIYVSLLFVFFDAESIGNPFFRHDTIIKASIAFLLLLALTLTLTPLSSHPIAQKSDQTSTNPLFRKNFFFTRPPPSPSPSASAPPIPFPV
jgi:hypothetical protein